MSIIDESGPSYVRMANLACIGSKAINGVAAMHTDLLRKHVLSDWNTMYPGKIRNVTNGVTPRRWIAVSYPRLTSLITEAIDMIASGHFCQGDQELFRPLVDSLLYDDQYTLFADYQDYIDCQDKVGETFLDKKRWTKMSILNTARMGKFSSDRSIVDYSKKIWDVKPFPVELKWEKLPKDGILFTPRKNKKEAKCS